MKKSILILGLGLLLLIAYLGMTYEGDEDEYDYLNSIETTLFNVDGDSLYMSGLINSKTFNQLKTVIESNPQVNTIIMLDVPGSVDDDSNLAMSKWVYDKGLNTHLLNNSTIASGGVDFYLAGNKRTMDKGASMGVHSWDSSDGEEGLQLSRDDEAHKKYLEYYDYVNITEDFYWFTLNASPADSIYNMTEEDIEFYDIITD